MSWGKRKKKNEEKEKSKETEKILKIWYSSVPTFNWNMQYKFNLQYLTFPMHGKFLKRL